MRKLKSVIFAVGLMLFTLSAAMLCLSVKNISAMPSPDSYEDKGIYTFVPYQVLPVQVENTGAIGRNRRMNPTKTVYMVYYKDNSGSGYQWTKQAVSRESGQEIVNSRAPVKRRVLNIPDKGIYITVEPEETAKSYIAGLQKKYRLTLVVSVVYILFYVLAWCIVLKQGR